jgi:hypothetical protein
MLPPNLQSIHPLVALLIYLLKQVPSSQTVKMEASKKYRTTKARVSSFAKTRLAPLPSPPPLPHLTKRLISVTFVTMASLCLMLVLWHNSVHNNSHVSGDTSKSLGLHLLTPDESFGAIQTPPPPPPKGKDGKKKGKKPPGKTQEELAEIEEAKNNFTLPMFWTVHDGTGRGSMDLAKPAGVRKVMGLVFYGQRTTAPILDCYLKACFRLPYTPCLPRCQTPYSNMSFCRGTSSKMEACSTASSGSSRPPHREISSSSTDLSKASPNTSVYTPTCLLTDITGTTISRTMSCISRSMMTL